MWRVWWRHVHWCLRYSSGRTTFLNILSIWANKNNNNNNNTSAILNLIHTKLHRIHGRIVINACVKSFWCKRYLSGQTNHGQTEPKSLSLTNFFWWGIIYTYFLILCSYVYLWYRLLCSITDRKLKYAENLPNVVDITNPLLQFF